MTDRPINMSADQVQALLAGKTQHRVVLKDQPEIETIPDGQYVDSYCSERKTPENPRGMSRYWCLWTNDNRQGRDFCKVPWVPGDRLWVRECFAEVGSIDSPWLLYRASGYERECQRYGFEESSCPPENAVPWKSGALMPRLLSRLTLIVTDVRVQRVQEISEDDAIYEGARPFFDKDDVEMVPTGDGGHIPMMPLKGPVDALRKAWDARHKRPEHQWEANPWVCSLTFDTIHQNIDEVKT